MFHQEVSTSETTGSAMLFGLSKRSVFRLLVVLFIVTALTMIGCSDDFTNNPPVATNDAATTLSGSPVTINVLANDTDADADDVLTVSIATSSTNGTTTVNANETVTYTPDAGFVGTDTFAYTVDDGSDTDTATVTVVVTAEIPLSGVQEVPLADTPATGTATLTLNGDQTEITYSVTVMDVTDVLQAHIHNAPLGVNGPIFLFLCTNLGNAPEDVPTPQACPAPVEVTGTNTGTFTGTLTADDFIPVDGLPTFADGVAAILNGNAYFNVHTTAFPGGEVRGQTGTDIGQIFDVPLSGVQEVPLADTTATGTAKLALNNAQTQLIYSVTVTDVADVLQAHIHNASLGVNGPIFLFLCTNLDNAPADVSTPQACPAPVDVGGTNTVTFTGTLTADDFIPVDGLPTFADGVAAILNGNTYFNVHTTAFPGGEVRGQAGADIAQILDVPLSGVQEVPFADTMATGTAKLALNAAQTQLIYSVTVMDVADVRQAHIHNAALGANGPIFLFLCTNLDNAPADVPTPQACPAPVEVNGTNTVTFTGTLTADDFIPVDGLPTFAAGVAAILNGNTYFNVHTTAFPGGETRGQIDMDIDQVFDVPLSGAQEVPPAETNATGTAKLAFNAAQTQLTYAVTVMDVTDVLQSHIHNAALGVNGPIFLFLCTNLGNAPEDVPIPQACPAPVEVNGTNTVTFTGTLTADDFIPVDGLPAFADGVAAILNGNAYFNVHTTAFPGGEVRGQTDTE